MKNFILYQEFTKQPIFIFIVKDRLKRDLIYYTNQIISKK